MTVWFAISPGPSGPDMRDGLSSAGSSGRRTVIHLSTTAAEASQFAGPRSRSPSEVKRYRINPWVYLNTF
jgi:hypothetical protein